MSKLDEYVEIQLKPLYKILDICEEKDPKLAEKLGLAMTLKISRRWTEIVDKNRKTEKLKDVDNLN